MTTLPNMGIILPTLGGDSGTWDDKLNAGLALIDAHDHTSGKGTLVPSAGININADLPFAAHGATGLGQAAFTAVAALVTGSKVLFVNAADNELYWRTNAGTNVKLTNGASINTTLVGGIVGDYASVGAEVAYDDANDRYTFKQQSTKPWARIMCGGVQIAEFNTTESVFTRLVCNAALAASYDITFAAALPGSTTLVQISSAGALSYSNTIPTPTAPDYKFSSQRTMIIPAGSAAIGAGSDIAYSTGSATWTFPVASANQLVYPIRIEAGMQIEQWTVYCRKTTAATNTINAELYKVDSTATKTQIGATQSNSANNPGNITLSQSGLTQSATVGEQYYLVLFKSATLSAGDIGFHAEVKYTRP